MTTSPTSNDPPTDNDPSTPINNDSYRDLLNEEHSSQLLSYADSSPTENPNSLSSSSYQYDNYSTPLPSRHEPTYSHMDQSVSQLHEQVSMLTNRLESILNQPSPQQSQNPYTHNIIQANHSNNDPSTRKRRPDPPADEPLPLASIQSPSIPIPIVAHATIATPYDKPLTHAFMHTTSIPIDIPAPTKLPPPSTPSVPTPTIIPSPQLPIPPAAIAPTYIYPKDIKLSLTSYKQGHNYLKWKRLCIIEISCNTKYMDIVIDDNGELIYNPNMSNASSRALFLATTKALGSLVDNYVSSSDIQKANGIILWETLDQSEMNTNSTLIQRQALIRNFATIAKHRNETLEKYTTRFETKLDEMKIKNLTVPSEAELVCQYISSLKMNTIFSDTLRKFDEQTWYYNQSWIQIMIWCKNEIAVFHTINGTTPDTPFTPCDSPSNINVPGDPSNSSNRNRNQRGNRNNPQNGRNNNNNDNNVNDRQRLRNNDNNVQDQPTNPRPRFSERNDNNPNAYNRPNQNTPNQPYDTPPSPFLEELRADVQRSSNHEAIFRFLHNNHPATCPIHNGASHAILNCYLLGSMCRECGVTPSLMEVRRSVGLLPPRNQGGSSNPPAYQQPPPSSQPAPPQSILRNAQPQPATPPPQAQPNPYRRQQQPTYIPYNNQNNNTNTPHNARRITNDNQSNETSDNEYYENDNDNFDDGHDASVIEVEDNNNTDLNVYSNPTITCRKTVQFSHDAINQSPTNNIISTTTHSPLHMASTPHLKSIHRFVFDSGATDHMTPVRDLFESIHYYDQTSPSRPVVIMGDEKTQVPIMGHGFINITIHGHRLRVHALYIPDMGATSLFSIRQHMRYQGCIFHAEAKNTTVSFPDFIIYPRVSLEIDVLCRASTTSTDTFAFDESTSIPIPHTTTKSRAVKLPDRRHTKLNLISQSKASLLPKSHYPAFPEQVLIQRLVPHATTPSTSTSGSIGHDVTSIDKVSIAPSQICKIPTGLAASLPTGMYIRIAEQSSMALKGTSIQGGVIDSDYRGEIMVLLRNDTPFPITINPQQTIAQFIFERASTPFIQIPKVLPTSPRNEGGFGSTDKDKSSRVKTFRINSEEILLIDNNNHKHPRLRRINTRSSQHLQTNVDPHNTSQVPPNSDNNTTVTHHLLNDDESTPVDSALKQKVSPIDPTQHKQSDTTSQENIPIPSPVDRVNSALPKAITMSHDALRKSIGFLSTKPLLKHLATIGDTSLKVPSYSDNPSLDPGMTASIKSTRRNTTPSTLPPNYSDIWHIDIGFGPCTAIGGIRYTLLAVDKSSRFKLVYGLKNLTTSLHSAIKQFLMDCGKTPTCIRTDFDPKLIAGNTKKILTDHNVKIEAAPPHRQHQNGLVERAWQTIVSMTRNWMTSARLPAKYWYFGVKRACEVLNMLPIK